MPPPIPNPTLCFHPHSPFSGDLWLSLSIMLSVTLLGVWRFKLGYLSLLVPRGVPLLLAPILGVIETLSYVIRALSLGLRLGANISAGHLLFAILSGFALQLWGQAVAPVIVSFLVFVMIFIALLEIMVAIKTLYTGGALVRKGYQWWRTWRASRSSG